MPLPEILAALIREFGDKFSPDSERKEYKAYVETWRLYLDLLEMDQTKLGALLEPHADEAGPKYELRQKIAAVFNYVPSLVRMTINYLHSQQPTYEIQDERLAAFISNCDGSGRSLVEYIRREALPLTLVFGFIDSLVQNPATETEYFQTAADITEELSPRVMTITPLQRRDWSVRRDHAYNWLRFRDYENENAMPFLNVAAQQESYITISAFVSLRNAAGEDVSIRNESGEDVGFWVRSSRVLAADVSDGGAAPATPTADEKKKGWSHDGNFFFTKRCPIATIYYQQSIDPERRHHGISKIAMIAILTRKIIQLLSWSDEDVLANLAIFALPGDEPKDDKGKAIPVKLSPFTVLWLGGDAKVQPSILQGDVAHIDVKWKIIDAYIREILRLAFLIGASVEAEQITSGVQSVVARNELFQELADIAGAVDIFALDVLTLAACNLDGVDMSRDEFIAKYNPKIEYNKGPYTVDPLDKMITNTELLIEAFADISPTMVKEVRRQLAAAALYNEDETRATVFAEINESSDAELARRKAQRDAMTAATQTAAANISATAQQGNGGTGIAVPSDASPTAA